VSGDYQPGKSDLNFFVVLSSTDFSSLKKIRPFFRKWERKKISLPLLFTEDYIKRSADVFPIEFLDLKENNFLLWGEDFLSSLSIKTDDLRLECERKLKGSLIRLKQAFLETGGERQALRRLLAQSLGFLFPIFRNVIRLRDKIPPFRKEEVIKILAKEVGIAPEVFLEILKIRKEEKKLKKEEEEELFARYLKEIERLVEIVDKMERG
jgi:hypothetical protein